MGASPPAWNSANRHQSFEAFTRWLGGQARMRFLEAGSHVELFFLMSDAGDATMFPAPPGVERDVIARSIRQQVAQSKSYGVLHIVEAWSYIRRQEKDHTYRQIMEGEIGVSNLKAEDKTEALMVAMETRDGHSLTMLSPILRGKDEVALADEIEFTEPNEGRYSGWFRIVGKQNER